MESTSTSEMELLQNRLIPDTTQISSLIQAMSDNNMMDFQRFLQQTDFSLRQKDGGVCVLHAVVGHKNDYLKLLLENGANSSAWDSNRRTSALHITVKDLNVEGVQLLLAHGADASVKDHLGRTPLHTLAARGSKSDNTAALEAVMSIALLLLSMSSLDVDAEDNSGLSAVQLAAALGTESLVKILIEHGANPDQPDECDPDGRTVGEFLAARDVALPSPWTAVVSSGRDAANELYESLMAQDLVTFTTIMQRMTGDKTVFDKVHGGHTCLQYACARGMEEFASRLLAAGASVDVVSDQNRRTALHAAAETGFHAIVRLLISHDSSLINVVDHGGETALHTLARTHHCIPDRDRQGLGVCGQVDYNRALSELISSIGDHQTVVNLQDNLGNTPLHLAVATSNVLAIKLLLRKGAYIGIKNCYGDVAVQGLPPELLKEYLDECVSTNDKMTYDKNLMIEFNYDMFAPRCQKRKERNICTLPEIIPLWYLAHSMPHRHLLKHPLLDSFLMLKWQQVRSIVFTDILIYILFCITLITHIFVNDISENEDATPGNETKMNDGSTDMSKHSDVHLYLAKFVYVVCIFMTVILIGREIIRMLLSPRYHYFHVENIILDSMLFMTALLLFMEMSNDTIIKLSSTTILFALSECFIMLGKTPWFALYVVMFRTVLIRFVKFLAWYIILVFAFALSMHILFSTDHSFSTLNKSMVKILVMAIGEIDYGGIPLKDKTPTAYFLLIPFLFLIALVLMNLLNGLAVADTGEIFDKSKLYSCIALVDNITYVESMMLGDPFHMLSGRRAKQNGLTSILSLPSRRNQSSIFAAMLKWCARRVLLFQDVTSSSQVQYFPNRRGGTVRLRARSIHLRLSEQIIREARAISQARRQPVDADCWNKRLASIEAKVEKILQKHERLVPQQPSKCSSCNIVKDRGDAA